MEIRNVKHKGLKSFIEKNNAKGLPADRLKKIRQVLGFLLDMDEIDELFDPPKFKAHIFNRRPRRRVFPERHWQLAAYLPP